MPGLSNKVRSVLLVMTPSDAGELEEMLKLSLECGKPAAVRYPRGTAKKKREGAEPVVYGKAEVLARGKDVALLSFGSMLDACMEAKKILEESGYSVSLVNMRFAKPLDEEVVKEMLESHPLVLTAEDGMISGGAGERIAAIAAGSKESARVLSAGVPDTFVPQGEPQELYHLYRMDGEGIALTVKEALEAVE